MESVWKEAVEKQFGAAIDTLEAAIVACPDDLWGDGTKEPPFWYLVSHTLFWLDYYLSESREGFAPPAPFGLEEFDPAGVMPPRVYTKAELLEYLEYDRRKFNELAAGLNEETERRRFKSYWMDFTRAEILLYNLRHVQHGGAQLNLILRQQTNSAPRWVRWVNDKPEQR